MTVTARGPGAYGARMADRSKQAWINKSFNRFFNWWFRRRRGKVAFRGAPCLILHTVGAKTGQPRQTPLLYLRVDDQQLAVVGSNGGDDTTPAWVHNLRKQPTVEVELDGGRVQMVATTASDERRAELWPRLVAMYKSYASYQSKTDRQIPVILLTPGK